MPQPKPHLLTLDLSTPDGVRIALRALLGRRWCSWIAARAGVEQSVVSHTIRRRRLNKKVMRVIARVLQRPVAELFPPRAEEAA